MKLGIMFDLDGTLWDSTEQIVTSWNQVLQQYQKQVSLGQLQSLMGQTMDEIARQIMPEEPLDTRMKIFDQCLEEENRYLEAHGGVLFPNVEETLQQLSRQYPLFIVSNCQSGYIEAFLHYHKLEQYFTDHECFGNTGKGKAENEVLVAKRHELDRVIYVGDIQGDYDATKKAGFAFVHAAYGFGTVDADVERAASFRELPEKIEKTRLKMA